MKLRRWFKRTLVIVTALVVILITLNLILTAIWSRQVDRKLAELRARGEPVTLADLIPKHVPDDENAALVYDKALTLLSKEDQSKIDRYLSGSGFPQPSSNVFNADDDVHIELESELKAVVGKQARIIPLIQDALAKPHYVELTEQSQDSYSYTDIALYKLDRISRFLATLAMIQTRDGRTQDAIHTILLGLRVAQPQDSYITAPSGDLETAMYALRMLVREHDITDERAESFYRELGVFDPESEAVRYLQIERVVANHFFGNVRRDLTSIIAIDYTPPQEGLILSDRLMYRFLGFWWRPLLCKDQLYYLNASRIGLEQVRRPYREVARPQERAPLYAHFAADWLIGNDLRQSRDSRQAQIGLAQTTLALKSYKNRHGSYPASLSELKTYPGWKLPQDPFSGKPFGYNRIGQGFRVWSWGDDLVDDGGRLDNEIHGPGTGGRADMVWIVEK